MSSDAYWLKQTGDKPLFPDLQWSRPENRALAGKLLIIGGNAYGFAAPAEAYTAANKAGIGVARVVLPEALRHTVGNVFEAGDFAPGNPSGSFSQKALNDFLIHASWADGVLVAGDLGRNSETAVLLEKFIENYHEQLTIAKDAVNYLTTTPQSILARPKTTLALSFAQLQKLAVNAHLAQAFTFEMGLVRLVDLLHEFTAEYPVNLVIKYLDNIVVAVNGEISTTKLPEDMSVWRVKAAAYTSVWWLQNPSKPFEALSTAVTELQ